MKNQGQVTASPWLTVLAHTLATEPFIIAGTSLEEPDLEYFLSGRRAGTVRKDRGPSFLVEPFPDAATARDCDRHGLILFEGTFEEFLQELIEHVPSRPLPTGPTTQLRADKFTPAPTKRNLALFSRDFSFVAPVQGIENADLGFYVGRPPSWMDISLNRDVSRDSTQQLKTLIRNVFEKRNWSNNILILDDSAGSGKTTLIKRALYDLAIEGIPTFDYIATSAPDVESASSIFNTFNDPFIILVDNIADHLTSIMKLYTSIHRSDFLIVGCERSYRINHVSQIMAGTGFRRFSLETFNASEAKDLIAKMDDYGLTSFTASNLSALADDLAHDPIALAVCRVMNDFRPAEEIVRSVLSDADHGRRERYLASALAAYCYRSGISHDILVAAFDSRDLSDQFRIRDILPLSYSDRLTSRYVVPMNPLLGQRVLRELSSSDASLTFEVYCSIGAHISAYVNRSAIVNQTPEARLAGRLFDFDDVVTEMIPGNAEAFYLRMRRHWDWNSRYWEQFALMKLDQFKRSGKSNRYDSLSQAVSHAKHAVKIERHPHPLTTLGKILLEDMASNPARLNSAFKEAFDTLDEAITREGKMSRIAIHPYMALFGGTSTYLNRSGELSRGHVEKLRRHLDSAGALFGRDTSLMILARDLSQRVMG